MFSQKTKVKPKSSNKFKSFRIVTIVDRVWRWPYEFKYISLKNR